MLGYRECLLTYRTVEVGAGLLISIIYTHTHTHGWWEAGGYSGDLFTHGRIVGAGLLCSQTVYRQWARRGRGVTFNSTHMKLKFEILCAT